MDLNGSENLAKKAIETLQGSLELTKRDYEVLESKFKESCLLASEGKSGAEAQKKRLRLELQEAEAIIQEKEAALDAATIRHQAVLKAIAAKDEEERWNQLEVLTHERQRVAEELEQTVQILVEQFNRLLAMGPKLDSLAPKKEATLSNGPLATDVTTGALRSLLVKRGMLWASRTAAAYPPHTIPTLTERIRESNAWILKFKPRSKKDLTANTSEELFA